MSINQVSRAMVQRCVLSFGLVLASATAVQLMAPVEAQAQSKAQPRERGVAAGRLLISPRIRIGGGYNTNIMMNSDSEGARDAAELTVSPSLRLTLRDTALVKFSAYGGLSWRKYFNIPERYSRATGINANGGLALSFNDSGAVSFRLTDNIRQSNDAVYEPDLNDDAYALSFLDYAMDLGPNRTLQNTARAELNFHPGGNGENAMGFTGGLNAGHTYTHFQSDRSRYDHQAVHGGLRLGWRFLPRSVLYVTGQVGHTFYQHPYGTALTSISYIANENGSQAIRNNDSTSLFAGLGLRSQILRRLGVMARVGYSTAWYDQGANPGTIAAQLQLDSQLTESMRLRFGYSTNFADTTFANYLIYHRLYGNFALQRRIVNFQLSAFAQSNKYSPIQKQLLDENGQPIETYNVTQRHDWPVGGSTDLSFNAGDYVVIGANYSILMNLSNFQAEPSGGWSGPKLTGNPEFIRHRVYLYVSLAL